MTEDARQAYERNAAIDAAALRAVGMEPTRPPFDEAVRQLAAVWPSVAPIPADGEVPVPWPTVVASDELIDLVLGRPKLTLIRGEGGAS